MRTTEPIITKEKAFDLLRTNKVIAVKRLKSLKLNFVKNGMLYINYN